MAAGVFINEKSHCENSDTYSWTRNRIIYDNEKFRENRVHLEPQVEFFLQQKRGRISRDTVTLTTIGRITSLKMITIFVKKKLLN